MATFDAHRTSTLTAYKIAEEVDTKEAPEKSGKGNYQPKSKPKSLPIPSLLLLLTLNWLGKLKTA